MRYIYNCLFPSAFKTLAVRTSDRFKCQQTKPLTFLRHSFILAGPRRTYASISAQTPEDMAVNTSGRLAALRTLMKERKVDVYGMSILHQE
jgi:hypothetical protein